MKYAVKKTSKVMAYRLGDHTAMEEALVREGAIRRLDDGSYALFSQEAVNGTGEKAGPGDYFKVDTVNGRHYPYPISQAYFEENHRHIQGDVYEQIPRPVAVWQDGDGPCEEMDFLLTSGRLTIRPEDDVHYFHAVLWNAPLSAARDATVVFYQVDRDSEGRIADIEFNFVARREFERDYESILSRAEEDSKL